MIIKNKGFFYVQMTKICDLIKSIWGLRKYYVELPKLRVVERGKLNTYTLTKQAYWRLLWLSPCDLRVVWDRMGYSPDKLKTSKYLTAYEIRHYKTLTMPFLNLSYAFFIKNTTQFKRWLRMTDLWSVLPNTVKIVECVKKQHSQRRTWADQYRASTSPSR